MSQMAVWMDRDEAKVFHVTAETFEEAAVHSPNHHVHRHPKRQETSAHNHPDDEHHYFQQVAAALASADQILLMGPSMTKLHFLRYLQKHTPALEPRVIGVESADHPTDRQLVAHVRQYFHLAAPAAG